MNKSIYSELDSLILNLKNISRENKMEYFEVLQTFSALVALKEVERSEDFNEIFPDTLNNFLVKNQYDMIIKYAVEHLTGELSAMLSDYKEE